MTRCCSTWNWPLRGGSRLDDAQVDRLRSAGGVDAATVAQILGYNFSADTERSRPSLSSLFRLSVNLDGEEASEDGPTLPICAR